MGAQCESKELGTKPLEPLALLIGQDAESHRRKTLGTSMREFLDWVDRGA